MGQDRGQDFTAFSAERLAAGVRHGEWSASELTEAFLARISNVDGAIHAWRRVDEAGARRSAEAVDRKRAAGETLGALAGVPIGLKDIFVTQGLETGCGSRMLEGWIPGYEGTHAARLRAADAVVLGKLAMDEFAMGSSNENTPYEAVANPWHLDFVPGGSSGGSAAAVAARTCALSLGSDTGGSIRQPASLCGVAGLKPTYGRISRHGMIAFASSLDQAGPMALEVRDLALALGVLAGPDAKDSTASSAPVDDYLAACGPRGERSPGADGRLEGVRIGVHRQALELDGLDEGVRRAFEAALVELGEAGAKLVDVELPHFDLAIACYYVLCTAEAASNLARYDGLRYGPSADASEARARYEATRAMAFGAEVKRRIMLGTFVLRADSYEAYYGRAMRVRRKIAEDYDAAFAGCDLMVSPVSPVPGFRRGERIDDPLAMYLSDVFTIGVNLAGLPAASVPCGWAPVGAQRDIELPVGLQFIGPAFSEAKLLAAAAAFEDRTRHCERKPSGLAGGER